MNLKGLALYLSAAVLPFGELPFRAVDEPATCLRATGAPGELVRARPDSLELLDARLGRVSELPARFLEGCPQVAPGMLAVVERRSEHSNVTGVHVYLDGTDAGVVLRPGGSEGTPAAEYVLTIGDAGENHLAAARSPRGDALVAVTSLAPTSRAYVVASRRAPGGAFGPRETLFSAPSRSLPPTIAAAMSDSGEAIVAWAVQPPSDGDRELWVSTAAPGAPFGAPHKLADLRLGAPFALAVAPDGRALLAFTPAASGSRAMRASPGAESGAPARERAAPAALAVGASAHEAAPGALAVVERPPGGGFGAPVRVGAVRGFFGAVPAVALRGDGSAVVVWSDLDGGATQVVTRARPAAFGEPVTLAPAGLDTAALARATEPLRRLLRGSGAELGVNAAGPDTEAGNPRIAFLPDGRTLVTWAGVAPGGGAWWDAPHAAILGEPARTLGAPVRDAGSVAPLVLADGRAAVAWTDERRLHIAVEGQPDSPDGDQPNLTVRPLGDRVLGPDEPLHVAIGCSAACDVRAQVVGSVDAVERLTLPRAGTRDVELGSDVRAITGTVRVRVRWSAPGARHARERTLTLNVRRRPGALIPRIRGLTARRAGSTVIVRWRTSRPADPRRLLVYGTGARGTVIAIAQLSGAPRTRFSARLNAGRSVTILIDGRNGGLEYATTAVR